MLVNRAVGFSWAKLAREIGPSSSNSEELVLTDFSHSQQKYHYLALKSSEAWISVFVKLSFKRTNYEMLSQLTGMYSMPV
jgi:hypothetical protein